MSVLEVVERVNSLSFSEKVTLAKEALKDCLDFLEAGLSYDLANLTMINFIFYFVSQDKKLSAEESEFINQVFRLNIPHEHLDMYMQQVMQGYNPDVINNMIGQIDEDVAASFRLLAALAISIDGEVSEEEYQELEKIITADSGLDIVEYSKNEGINEIIAICKKQQQSCKDENAKIDFVLSTANIFLHDVHGHVPSKDADEELFVRYLLAFSIMIDSHVSDNERKMFARFTGNDKNIDEQIELYSGDEASDAIDLFLDVEHPDNIFSQFVMLIVSVILIDGDVNETEIAFLENLF